MKKSLIIPLALTATFSCSPKTNVTNADIYTLDSPADTTYFEQAPFEWKITPRYDYSKVLVSKLFLSHADYDKEYLGHFKIRDNGKQFIHMNFEQALEVIKGMDALTLGLPKIVYLVGWQYNGHDSKYPALFKGNEALKRSCDNNALESIKWLMEQAKKYNTTVSLHLNLYDAYPDSPLFEKYLKEDVLAKDSNGELIQAEWGYKISYAAEFEKGLLQERVDSLCKILPIVEAGTVHVDAFHNNVPRPYLNPDGSFYLKKESPISPWHGHTAEQDIEAKKKIILYFDSKGIDITTESVINMSLGNINEGYFPMYWHYNSFRHAISLKPSQACGGNCCVPVFGNNLNVETIFKNNPDINTAFDVFKKEFCKQTLIYQYLNTFDRKAIVTAKNGASIGVFANGVRTMFKDGKLYVAKDGYEISDGENVFVPAPWLENSIIAFSENGYVEKTWTVPQEVCLGKRPKAWTVSTDGLTEFKNFKVSDNQVSLKLNPGEMILIKK